MVDKAFKYLFHSFILWFSYNVFYRKVYRDSAPHGSQQPAKYMSKMTSILKEKGFIIIDNIFIVIIIKMVHF